jgi:pSer/pThr/pTyr-binding forkhead associated (FHA) protein
MAQQFLLKSMDDGAETPITGNLTAGRSPECGLRLPGGGPEGGPSRKHAQLSLGDGGLWVEDLGSKNGTFVNDQLVTARTRLSGGDRLRFDRVSFLVHVPVEDADATVMRPVAALGAAPPLRAVPAQPAAARSAPAIRPAAGAAAAAAGAAPARMPPPAPVAAGGGTKDWVMPGAWADPEAARAEGSTVLLNSDQVKEMAAQPAAVAAGDVDVPTLTCVSGPQAGRRFRLEKAAPGGRAAEWTLGSDAGQDVQLSGDGISGQHACIVNEGLRWKIVDRLSSNGTFVNNKRAVTSFLSSGDEVRLGMVACVFALPGLKAAPRSRPGDSMAVAGMRPKGKRIDVRTLVISFAVTAAILFVAWRFLLG